MRMMSLCAGAAISSMQPPRLLLGTLAIAFIAVVGSVIDAAGGGLYMRQLGLNGSLEQAEINADRIEAIEGFQNKLPTSLAMEETEDPSGVMNLDEVVAACEAYYLEQRAGLTDDGELAALEANYRETLELLRELESVGLFTALLTSEAVKRAAACAIDRVADPAPALASTTSVPASWMRGVRASMSACDNSTPSTLDSSGRMVTPL